MIFQITFFVISQFFEPEILVFLRYVRSFFATVTMPKTAVYEYGSFVSGQNNVGFSRQIFSM